METTGAATEFYDKFNIRYHISVIFKYAWKKPSFRHSFLTTARWAESSMIDCLVDRYLSSSTLRDEREFVRFLNMAINDVTYLLDESLQLLRKIHDIETEMDNKTEWEATPMVVARWNDVWNSLSLCLCDRRKHVWVKRNNWANTNHNAARTYHWAWKRWICWNISAPTRQVHSAPL